MQTTKERAFSFRALVQKIRNYFKKPSRKKKPLNWFRIFIFRLEMLNPFQEQLTSYKPKWRTRLYFFFQNYYLESYMEWLRYRTDLAYRLDKKIEKVMNEYVAKTDWAHSYELECDSEYGNLNEYTLVYYKEEQSEDVYSKWTRGLQNKIFSVAESERCWRLSCAYVSKFINTRIGETWARERKIYFCNGGYDE
jgi:hypothetical protein